MLRELRVENLGVIADLGIVFGPGMTVLTGETGAGKTLVVEAIELLLGARSDSGLVRAGATEARVEARFDDLAGRREIHPGDGEDIDLDEDDEVVLTRVVPASGRSRAYVNGRMVPVSTLAELGRRLVDLHGQHSHHSLLTPATQRAAVDRFGGADTAVALADYRDARACVLDLDLELASLGGDGRERAREADLLRFQVAEIDAAGIEEVDEERSLEAEEQRLAAAQAIREATGEATRAIDGSVVDVLGTVAASLQSLPGLDEVEKRVRAVQDETADIARDLRRIAEGADDDPDRLEAIAARRRLLHDLRRKYGETLAEILEFREESADRLSALEGAEARALEIDAERAATLAKALAAGQRLSAAREQVASVLATAITEELHALGMPGATLTIDVRTSPAERLPAEGLPADGFDEVQLMLAANPGEPGLPLARVASGGELARTMLATRVLLTEGAPTLVFDEVDAGIGGQAAVAVGRRLGLVARNHQVLCVTHLAQVAAYADGHIAVEKGRDRSNDSGRTVTVAAAVEGPARVGELSRMLSGHDTDSARRHAEELLAAAAASVRAPS